MTPQELICQRMTQSKRTIEGDIEQVTPHTYRCVDRDGDVYRFGFLDGDMAWITVNNRLTSLKAL